MRARQIALVVALLLVLASLPSTRADVVRPAPEFQFRLANGKIANLRSVRGRPVVLLVANSPTDRRFRAELKNIVRVTRRLENRKTLIVAAFANGASASGSEFALATNSAAVASAYRTSNAPFACAIIGTDGNLDAQTARVLSGQRILDVIDDAFPVEAPKRTE